MATPVSPRRPPTLDEVAERAQVSRTVASRVINNEPHVSRAKRDAVERAIRELGYTPNRAARALATRQTGVVVLAISGDGPGVFADPFFAQVIAGVSAGLEKTDLHLMLSLATPGHGQRRLETFLHTRGADGVILMALRGDDPLIAIAEQSGLPTVFGGRPLHGTPPWYVDVDNVGGARAATEHLISGGRRRIAMITRPADTGAGQARHRGYAEALILAGLGPYATEPADFTESGGADAMRALLRTHPDLDAVFAANDNMAAGALRVLRDAGRTVPGDVAVVGFDWMLGDNLGTAGWPASGEIDILEHVGALAPNTVYGTIHGPGYSGAAGIQGSKIPSAPVSDTFHVFSVDWTPGLIVWQLDGAEYHRATPASVGSNTWVFDHPFSLLLNLAVGGSWPGDPDASTTFPRQLLVDYVRAYSYTESAPSTPATSAPAPSTPATSAPASSTPATSAPASSTPAPSASASATPAATPSTTGTASLRSALSRRCIDVPAGATADGTRLQLWTCTGQSPQKWAFTGDGTLRALGKCMDPAGGTLTNGTPIQLVTCNGHPVQRFTLSPAGTLVNASSGRCVDVKDSDRANGAALQLWDCAGTANQRWTKR